MLLKQLKNLLYTADQIITSNTAYDINYKGSISENREASAGGENLNINKNNKLELVNILEVLYVVLYLNNIKDNKNS